jgi:methylated-DNA-[protein]-cysteine S-methyltransferase
MISYTEYSSPLGQLIIAATERGVCGLYFEQHKYFAGPQGWVRNDQQPHLRQAVAQLDEYFANTRSAFDVALDLKGTSFQQAVWRALRALPFGVTTSYGDIARRLGKPRAVRAVGTAIGRNPVSIIVPCHRVLGASGALSGYAGGVERKQFLLEHERHASNYSKMKLRA